MLQKFPFFLWYVEYLKKHQFEVRHLVDWFVILVMNFGPAFNVFFLKIVHFIKKYMCCLQLHSKNVFRKRKYESWKAVSKEPYT